MKRFNELDEAELRSFYCDIMEEIKKRISILGQIESGQVALPVGPAHELYFLQLRFICELLALGCIGVHGGIVKNARKKLLREYHAGNIIRQMEQLHSDFYPEPIQKVDSADGGYPKIEIREIDYLNKSKFRELYSLCGDKLHRGTIKRIFENREWDPSFDGMRAWKKLIVDLLDHHQIRMSNNKAFFAILMSNPRSGKAQGWFFERYKG